MQLSPLGDNAVLVTLKAAKGAAALDAVAKLAGALNTSPLAGVTDVVPSFTTVTVHYEASRIATAGESPFARVCAWIKSAKPNASVAKRKQREIIVPVCYGGEAGPDLAAVAARAKLTEEKVIQLHSKTVYRVAAVGFTPGFPYLAGLPEKLTTPRLSTPRTEVPAGSVGIGGVQTGIYPLATPGGWSLIGRTPLRLFRPEDEAAPTLFEPGDTVRFKIVTEKQAAQLKENVVEPGAGKVAKGAAVLEIVKPGALTTVQDLGRPGRQHLGITAGGAMDRESARVANLLLGNDENDALLELTITGPDVRFLRDTWIAVVGAEVRELRSRRPVQVAEGQIVSFAELARGSRAYLAVAGGLDVAPILGGAGTMLRSGLTSWRGRALRAGDRLSGKAGNFETRGDWSASSDFAGIGGEGATARFVRGPQWDWFSAEARRAFLAKGFEITAKSDRMGLRLGGPVLRLEEPRELFSEGVGFGSVQVPADGHPIVLMADRQTIGGYPKIAHVISVDLPKLAQARAGDLVRFEEIAVEAAQTLAAQREHSLALLASGVRSKLRRG